MRVFEGASALAALPSRVHLTWNAARRFIARTFRGDPLDRDKYAAFISYRHIEPDRGWAIWVHDALESYVNPKILRDRADHKRICRVFRDEEELAASTHLGEDIREALRRSDWLIVVCSPRSKERPYVNAEVDYFRELGRGDRILALLIEGEPATAFPPSLYEIRQSLGEGILDSDEPLAADVRPNSEMRARKIRRFGKLRLLASILGRRFDDLRGREQERRFRQLVRVATAAIAGLVVVAVLGIEAFREKLVADQKTQEVIAEEAAVSQTALAFREATTRPVDAAKLALASWPRASNDTKTVKLSMTLDALGQILPNLRERLSITNAESFAVFSPDGARIVTASADSTARLWDAASGRPVATLTGHTDHVTSAAFSRDGTRVLTASADRTARLWDASSGNAIATLAGHTDRVTSAAFSPDGNRSDRRRPSFAGGRKQAHIPVAPTPSHSLQPIPQAGQKSEFQWDRST